MADVTQDIITTIMADINAVMPNYQVLVSSYRLLVGAAEEIQRTPGVPKEVFERAVLRMDNAGTLIDIFLDLLLCKVSFTSDFLGVTCAPVDLFRILANKNMATDTPFHRGEQILQLEVLRRLLEKQGESRTNTETTPAEPQAPLEGLILPKPPPPAPLVTQPTAPPAPKTVTATVPAATDLRTPQRWQFPAVKKKNRPE